jgi:hypothetical protein
VTRDQCYNNGNIFDEKIEEKERFKLKLRPFVEAKNHKTGFRENLNFLGEIDGNSNLNFDVTLKPSTTA